MDEIKLTENHLSTDNYLEERKDLAAAFRWAERSNLHEAVANHFSLVVNSAGTKFLMNPNMWHFSRIKASDLLLLDVNDKSVLSGDNPPDATAWGLHGAIHKLCPHAKCIMHVHSVYATTLASIDECILPPINQVASMFFNRQVVDKNLLANVSNAENAVGTARQQLDFLSNGFKLRNAGDSNPSINNESTTYIYMAFAEQPFKFSNAR